MLEGYCETHHVRPVCLGGGDEPENLVDLTPEEHYVAHQILVKAHPEHPGLVWGALRLATPSRGNKAYGWLRRRMAAERSVAMRGRKLTAEHRAKVSASLMGNKRRLGSKHSAEHKMHLRQINLGKKMSPEAIERTVAGKRGVPRTDAVKAKISAAKLGKKQTPEVVEKRAAALRGRKLSPERCHQLRMANLGKKHSHEARAKMSKTRTGTAWSLARRAAYDHKRATA